MTPAESRGGFRPRQEHELERMPDRMLIGYVRDASRADAADQQRLAMGVLVERDRRTVEQIVRRVVPSRDVPDVVGRVIEQAIAAEFVPASRAHLRAWLRPFARRRSADYHRRRAARPVEQAMPDHEEALGAAIHAPAGRDAGDAEGLCIRLEQARLRRNLSDHHRAALLLHDDLDLSAKETAALIPGMSPENVAQIRSRHRRNLYGSLFGKAA